MSKHLRFGRLLSLLAILLTLSTAWSQAQNLSSEKQLLTFGFTTAANPGAQLGSDVAGVINQTTRTVAVTVPYQTNITGLVATFTSSMFSNVYYGLNRTTGTLAVSGTSPAVNYTTPATWTVEAENFSYENYVITVTKAAASSAKDITTFSATWTKAWTGACAAPAGLVLTGSASGTFAGTTITFAVPFGTNLDAIPVSFVLSNYATAVPASGSSLDFQTDADPEPDAVSVVVTAQDGSTQSFSLLPVVGIMSEDDSLTAFAVPNAVSVTPNVAVQTYTVVMPYSATAVAPTFTVAPWAHVYDANPTVGPFVERCSGASIALTADKTDTETFHFWIQAEDPSELSEWILVVTNAAVSTAKDLTGATGSYTYSWGHGACPQSETVTGLVGTISGTTVTFTVPTGVTSISLTGTTVSALATRTTPAALPAVITPGAGFEIVVTAEDASTKGYDVVLVNDPISNAKTMLTFGFHKAQNAIWTFQDWTVDYAGTINANKQITVDVAYNTDLHDLIAYFTSSKYSKVWVAESNQSLTPQCSDVTVNDHSNTLTYVVEAADGTQERYEVTVNKQTPRSGNDLTSFSLTGLPYCFGGTFNAAGTFNGTNIAVSVKSGTNVTSLPFTFVASPGATVTGPTSPANFTNPVVFTVTAESGAVKTYTVTVTPNTASTSAKLLTYWFAGANNSSLGSDAVGTVNEAAKTVEVWIPWDARASITNLKASFTLSTNAMMTHSEDTQVLQVSGVTGNDFTTPVAYTVWPEACSPTIEYFVTVKVIPNTNTGISAFTFNVTPCETGCDLVNKIDAYARRIYITVPYGTDLSSLAPNVVTVTPGATVLVAGTTKPWNTAVDFSAGPVSYTVTAPDGVTKATWTVTVTAPKCTEADILTFALPNAQVSESDLVANHGKPVVIDATNHTISVIIKNGTNLSKIFYERTLSCGATICCVGGNCQDNHYLDFSQGGCHTCVVTAEDETVTQEWTICVTEIDKTVPTVKTWSVMAYNCTDSVAVQSNEEGWVFIVNESALNKTVSPWVPNGYNLYDFTNGSGTATSVAALVAARLGNYATVSAAQANTPVYVKTNGLYGGTYWAFSVDKAGRISCISDQKLYLDICDVDVATLCDLRNQPVVWRYRLTEEVFVTYEENRAGGNIKFVQDATCGIMIWDQLGALPVAAYGEGAGLKNLIGTLVPATGGAPELKFVPVCCYLPTKSSTGNVVAPIELTYDNYLTTAYKGSYESMLVKVTTPMIVSNEYGQGLLWVNDGLDMDTKTVRGQNDWIIQSVFASPLMGKVIPTLPAIYQGIRTNVNWGSIYGLFTPRKEADITVVTAPLASANPNPVVINGVIPGQCKSTTVKIFNEGVGNMVISALYLDDTPANDEFNLVTPPAVPFTLGTWTSQTVTVNFCPLDGGAETTNLIVEYGIGKTLVIPINGTTVLINSTPFCEDFNSAGWNGDFTNGWTTNGTAAGNTIGFFKGGWYGGNARTGGSGYAAVLYAFNGYTCYAMTPGYTVTGTTKYLTFYQGKRDYFLNGTAGTTAIATDVRKVWISTDNQATWTEIYGTTMDKIPEVVVAAYIQPLQKVEIPLAAYAGQTVFFKFAATRTSSNRGEWFIDDVCVADLITEPVISVAPNPGDFGGVQVDATGTLAFAVKNTGVSVLKIKKVEITGDPAFSLVDTNVYPVEVTAAGGWAYTIGNSGTELDFSVDFKPTDIGVKTGKVVITYGLYSDMKVEIPLTGEGLSCYTAAVATIGQNYAPSQNTWFKYTADKFSIVQITSCDAHQDAGYNAVYAWDTYLYVYSDCAGTLIASNDDMEAACVYNRASSSVQTVINGGETVYIFWPLSFPTAAHAYEGFYFNINVTYPIDGDVCENAIPLTLPVVNHFGTTVGFNDDYNSSPCSPFSNYMDGNDKVYSITVAEEGYLTGSILGAYGSIHVLDMCPKEELEKFHCKAFVGGPNGGTFTHKKLTPGTYFVIISTWSPPQTVDYLLNLSWESGSAVENADLMSSLNVYPNPTTGKFTVNINNPEAADMTIELVNISGQVVYRNEVKAAYSYNEDIDASTFAKGVYYLKVNNGNGVKIEKVVVQ
jgi:hypothetical protein